MQNGSRSKRCAALLAGAVALGSICWCSNAGAQTTIANFEDNTFDGFGTGTNSGVTPGVFSAPTSAVIDTGPATDPTNVLDLTASGFNGGLSSGADLGYDFVQSGTIAALEANDVLTFDWIVPVSSTNTGFSQLYNIILNGANAGFHAVGGSSNATDVTLATVTGTVNQNPGYSGQINQVSINYDGWKAAMGANPGYAQIEFQTNNGGGAPADILFDNFTLSQVPEPASLGIVSFAALGLLRRHRQSRAAR
jgi:hypothetical protein